MVIDDIQDDGEAGLVRRLDEVLEAVGAAIGALDGEDMRRVVAPGDVAREFHRRHYLDDVHAQPLEVAELLDGVAERAGLVGDGAVKGADVQFVDDERIPGRHRRASHATGR